MSNGAASNTLRNILAKLYSNPISIERKARDAGIDTTRLSLNGAPVDLWDQVLFTAHANGKSSNLIQTVQEEYSDNRDLQNACADYQNTYKNEIPFIIVTMTIEEAQELADGTAFANIIHHNSELFIKVKPWLDQRLSSYTNERDSWKPHGGEETICDIVRKIANNLNQGVLFLSSKVVGQDIRKIGRVIDHCQAVGCVLIIDAVSMFHPKLFSWLEDSGLLHSEETVAVLVLSPLDHFYHEINKLIEDEFLSLPKLHKVKRRLERVDSLCEFGVGGLRSLNRWLYTTLPRTIQIMKQQRNNNHLPGYASYKNQDIQDLWANIP